MTAPKAPPRTETRGTMARTMALPGATAGPRPVALSTPPREVWVVADRNGVPWTAWSNEERAYGDAYVEDGYTLHRYVLAPATEREQATERERTGMWVLKHRDTGHYWVGRRLATNLDRRQTRAKRYPSKVHALAGFDEGHRWQALALTRRVRRGP